MRQAQNEQERDKHGNVKRELSWNPPLQSPPPPHSPQTTTANNNQENHIPNNKSIMFTMHQTFIYALYSIGDSTKTHTSVR